MNMKRRQFLILASVGGLGLMACRPLSASEALAPSTSAASGDELASDRPQGEPLLHFVSVADTGTGGRGQYAVAKAMTQYYRHHVYPFVLLAGDNIYPDGDINKLEFAFERPYRLLRQQGVDFYTCLGNHDLQKDNGAAQVKYPGFNMQGRYYTFQRGPVQFFALDTNQNADWPAQLAWLEEELKRSPAPWRVVFGHHNLYSSGYYGTNYNLISRLTPLFEHYGVQLYISGHEHHYERTQPINGTTYLVCGAGAQLRPVRRSPWTEFAAMRLSFAAYEVYPEQMVVRGIDSDGEVFDQGIIQR